MNIRNSPLELFQERAAEYKKWVVQIVAEEVKVKCKPFKKIINPDIGDTIAQGIMGHEIFVNKFVEDSYPDIIAKFLNNVKRGNGQCGLLFRVKDGLERLKNPSYSSAIEYAIGA